ncbi:MAG TPA: nucleotide exchange factor GrpE, partial [Cytophagales bacterium]|nr:nucleotide exchange factor GrpE [Cytophagales bacterium]
EVNKEDVFDLELHEAITNTPASKKLKGKIVDIIEEGYLIGEKIIRHAKVVIGS